MLASAGWRGHMSILVHVWLMAVHAALPPSLHAALSPSLHTALPPHCMLSLPHCTLPSFPHCMLLSLPHCTLLSLPHCTLASLPHCMLLSLPHCMCLCCTCSIAFSPTQLNIKPPQIQSPIPPVSCTNRLLYRQSLVYTGCRTGRWVLHET